MITNEMIDELYNNRDLEPFNWKLRDYSIGTRYYFSSNRDTSKNLFGNLDHSSILSKIEYIDIFTSLGIPCEQFYINNAESEYYFIEGWINSKERKVVYIVYADNSHKAYLVPQLYCYKVIQTIKLTKAPAISLDTHELAAFLERAMYIEDYFNGKVEKDDEKEKTKDKVSGDI